MFQPFQVRFCGKRRVSQVSEISAWLTFNLSFFFGSCSSDGSPVLIQLFITTSVMQLREVIVIPFRMSFMQCLFIGKVLCEDFEIFVAK
jgi:hypothetical protein